MKKAGNQVMTVVGGREVHPINVRVGGFYRAPTRSELRALVDPLERAREIALQTVGWTTELSFPDVDREPELVALSDPGGYPIDLGRIVSDRGLDIDPSGFDEHVVEEHVEHSNALHARIRERGAYLTGPLARYNLAGDRLRPTARDAARAAGLGPRCTNPFQSIVVRAVELVQACDEALALIDELRAAGPSLRSRSSRAGRSATVSPRRRAGCSTTATRSTTTGRSSTPASSPPPPRTSSRSRRTCGPSSRPPCDLPDDELALRCEQAIRNHDPCISCATHFLTLTVDRG